MTSPPHIKLFGCLPAVLFVLAALAAPHATAQNATDTTVVADTLEAPPAMQEEPTPAEDLLGFALPEPGVNVGDTLLARRAEFEPTRILDDVAGSFFFDLGGYGWPHGWSPEGLAPQHPSLRLDGYSFDDLITGRPRYDLLPPAFLEPLRLERARYGTPTMVHAQMREFEALEPLTEFRYSTGDGGLQSVLAVHAQERDVALFGEEQDGVIAFLFGYGGHAADNEYPNSRLERMRQTVARVRYEQIRWSLELRNFHNRRYLGAHGGVAENIYNRTFATVINADAERQTIRNDLSATLRTHVVPGLTSPLAATATWTAQTHRYQEPADTLATRAHRAALRASQSFRAGAHRLELLAEGWIDGTNWSPAMSRATRYSLYTALRDSATLAGFEAVLEGGVQYRNEVIPVGLLRLERSLGPLEWLGEVSHTGQQLSRVEAYGFGAALAPSGIVTGGRITQGRSVLALRFGVFDLALSGALRRERGLTDLFADDFPSGDNGASSSIRPVTTRVLPSPVHHATGTIELGFRREARRGIYATAQPTAFQLLNSGASRDHHRLSRSLPEAYLKGRLGARFLAFQDLDMDASVRARAWTPFASRTLHPETGLLVLPEINAPSLGSSNTVDLVFEANLFEAKLFLSFENIFSGLAFPGNQLVPVYPLPERRLRFSVWWPIMG